MSAPLPKSMWDPMGGPSPASLIGAGIQHSYEWHYKSVNKTVDSQTEDIPKLCDALETPPSLRPARESAEVVSTTLEEANITLLQDGAERESTLDIEAWLIL